MAIILKAFFYMRFKKITEISRKELNGICFRHINSFYVIGDERNNFIE